MSLSPDAQRGTLIALEPRIRAAFHPLFHEIARRKDLTAGAKVVYAVLCSYHQMFSDVFPGRERLAADTGLSAHQLVDATKSLVDAALLHVKRRGFGQTNVYTLLRWPVSPDIPSGITAVPGGISGGAEMESLHIEEKDLTEGAGHIRREQEAATLWRETLDRLRTAMNAANYGLTFEHSEALGFDAGVLVVQVRDRHALKEIEARYRPLLAQVLGEQGVRFVVG